MPFPSGCAIHFHPDGFTVPEKHILGRHAAGAGFLEAFCATQQADRMDCLAQSREHFDLFLRRAKANGRPPDRVFWIPTA